MKLRLALVKRTLTPAGKDRAILHGRFGVIGHRALHGDHSTLNADVASAVLKNTRS